MRLIRWLTATLVLTLPAACGQVEPVLMPVSMPECIYQGPSSMSIGNASVSLTLNGIGDAGVALVRLVDDETHSDLEAHLATIGDRWADRPEWVTTVLELRLDSSQGLDGVDETMTLQAGSYAVVCIDHTGGDATARVSGAVTVEG